MPRPRSPTRLHNDIFYCGLLALGLTAKCYLERVHHDRRRGITSLCFRIKKSAVDEAGLADNYPAMRYQLWFNHSELQQSQDISAVVMRRVQQAQHALEDDLHFAVAFVLCFGVDISTTSPTVDPT